MTERARWTFVPAAAVGVLLGALIGGIAPGPAWSLVAGLSALGLGLLLLPVRSGPLLGVATLAAGLACLYAGARVAAAEPSPMEGKVAVQGVVLQDRPSGEGQRRLVVQLDERQPTAAVVAVVPGLAAIERGDRVRLEGTVRSERRLSQPELVGVMFFPVTRVLERGQQVDPFQVVRGGVADRLEAALPQPQSTLAAGLLVGNPAFPPALQRAMNASGTTHIVAVSGFNVSVLAAAVLWMGIAVIGRRPAMLLACLVVGLFCMLIEDQPSVWRAGVMWGLATVAWFIGRSGFALNGLAVACVALVIWEPWLVFDPSFQLSAAGTLGLIALGLWLFDPAVEPPRGWRAVLRAIGAVAATTVVAWAATAPLTALNFGQVSLVTVPANLVIAPVVPLAMALAVAVVVAPVGPVSFVAWMPLTYIVRVVEFFGGLPGAQSDVQIGAGHAVIAYAVLGILVLAVVTFRRLGRSRPTAVEGGDARGMWHPPLWASGPLLVVSLLGLMLIVDSRGRIPGVWVLDVGQGDASLIRAADGRTVLIDGAADGRVLLHALERQVPFWYRRIDVVIASHLQQDHIGGLPALFERYRVGHLVTHTETERTQVGRELLRMAQQRGIPHTAMEPGDELWVGADLRLRAVNAPAAGFDDENDRSLVLHMSLGEWRFLFAGDMQPAAIQAMLARGEAVDTDVLKVPHHGSRNGLTQSLLDGARPQAAVISVGRGNRFGHPAPEVLRMLDGLAVFRTDLHGSVAFLPEGGVLRVAVGR